MSWSFSIVASSAVEVSEKLDAFRASQGAHCPDKLIDFLGAAAESACAVKEDGKVVTIVSAGHVDERGGDGTFQVYIANAQ